MLDADKRELRRGGDLVSITPQVFDLLEYLILNRERVVSKDDLINTIWKGRIVSDAAVTTRLNTARSVINTYMRLDPLYAPFASGFLGFAHYMLKQYVQALPFLRDCVSQAPNVRGPHGMLAATYAQMGKLEEARAAAAEVMRIEPNYTIGGTSRALVTFKNRDDDQHYFGGLRKAGLPA